MVHPKHVSLLPVGYTSYDNLGHNIYNSTQSLQYYNNYSLTPGHQDTQEPILSRFPSSLAPTSSRSNIQIYNQLQFPSTSNFGSMKKKKKATIKDDQSVTSESIDKSNNNQEKPSDIEYIPDFISVKANNPVKV